VRREEFAGSKGIVGKRRDNPYRSGRCADRIKVKTRPHRLLRGWSKG